MRIAFDAKRALNNKTGLGNYSRNLIQGLLNHYPENDYTLFSPSANAELAEKLEGRFSIILPEKSFDKIFKSIWRSYGVTENIRTLRTNIYHGLSGEIPLGMNTVKTKTVVTIHDLLFLQFPEHYNFFDRKIYTLKTSYAIKHADAIIAISNETRDALINILGADQSKIRVISPIVNTQPKSERSFDDNQYILHVASLTKRKNQQNLIEAFATICNRVKPNLVIAGNGPLLNELNYQIEKHQLKDRVKILTNVSDEDLRHLYAHSFAFIYPSVAEGYGMPIAEAVSAGIPSAASCTAAMKEAGGGGAIYFNPLSVSEIADAIYRLCNDEPIRKKLIDEGRKHLEEISEKRLTDKLMDLYKSL